jgi:cell division protein FtsB
MSFDRAAANGFVLVCHGEIGAIAWHFDFLAPHRVLFTTRVWRQRRRGYGSRRPKGGSAATKRRVNGKPRDVTFDIKRRIRLMIAPSIFLAITAYFGWSATQGNRGLVAQAERDALLRKVEADNTLAKQERARWETRVAGLRTAQLNLDTLDERARVMLNLADPADIVVQYRENEKP